MIVYPVIIAFFHLDHAAIGVFLGGTIHDVAQVVGAAAQGAVYSVEALDEFRPNARAT
jgi:uncharacterized membrane protein YadS